MGLDPEPLDYIPSAGPEDIIAACGASTALARLYPSPILVHTKKARVPNPLSSCKGRITTGISCPTTASGWRAASQYVCRPSSWRHFLLALSIASGRAWNRSQG